MWNVVRWPGAFAVTTLIFALIYYVTPDVKQRAFRWVTPGALVGVLVWLVGSVGFSVYISQVANVGALFGAFAGAIVLVGWLWLTNVALLFGAELDAEIERQKELGEGGVILTNPRRRLATMSATSERGQSRRDSEPGR